MPPPTSASLPDPSAASRRRSRVDSNPSNTPDPKRARASLDDLPLANTTNMSAKRAGKQPDYVDLTSSPPIKPMATPIRSLATGSSTTFRGGSGPRRLVVKNLRTTCNEAAVEAHQAQARKYLSDAVSDLMVLQRPQQPYETLYRSVEDLCHRKQEQVLYDMLKSKTEAFLAGEVLKGIKADWKSGNNIAMLSVVLRHWKRWSQISILLRSIFSYLDHAYLQQNKSLPRLNDLFINLFRKMLFDPKNGGVGKMVVQGMCDLIDQDRRDDGAFAPELLREAVLMMHVCNIYGKHFEPRFLELSAEYFTEFAEERRATNSVKVFIHDYDRLLKKEDYRCNAYNLDSTTKKQLMDGARRILIVQDSERLLDIENVSKLLDENDIGSMAALYELLRMSNLHMRLKDPWETYIKKRGATIVGDVSRGDSMIVRLLELRRRLDIMVREAFARREEFTYALREAFGSFINDKNVASAWGSGTSMVGEMIAKYVDMLLRGGIKTIPQILLSDLKDRTAAEQSGQSSTADEDAELDRQLDSALELFRFIEGKDVFEAFYKKDLSRRLLMGRSASRDAERNMIGKLKSECGSSFTQNLEQMFKDMELAREEMGHYKQWQEGRGKPETASALDLHVNILSAASWPTYPEVKLNVPNDVLAYIEQFERFYKGKHTGRKLIWKHNLSHCVVKAVFEKGTKELLVSAQQAVVLTLFNDIPADGHLSYEQISQSTGLAGPELARTLQSLACGKARVLRKHPVGREVSETDTFTVNRAFKDPKFRVKINQIQLQETQDENRETHERVAADRQFETQAAIVRIMKSRKTLTHALLVAEVINHTKKRGAMEPADIKANIEKLIEKDYLEREDNSYRYLA